MHDGCQRHSVPPCGPFSTIFSKIWFSRTFLHSILTDHKTPCGKLESAPSLMHERQPCGHFLARGRKGERNNVIRVYGCVGQKKFSLFPILEKGRTRERERREEESVTLIKKRTTSAAFPRVQHRTPAKLQIGDCMPSMPRKLFSVYTLTGA